MGMNLGDWGEQKFALLCAEAGVTCNKSQQDRTGWDFLIEFSPSPRAGIPHDLQPTDRPARIQVKTTAGQAATARLKLSNALRFAHDQTPCFVVLFMPDSKAGSSRVYARHFGEALMEQTLRKAREVSSQGRDDIHKVVLSVRFGVADDHSHDLLDWLGRETAVSPAQYGAEKTKLARSLGYEEGFLTSTVTFTSPPEALIDHQLGLPAEIDISNITISNSRFGIEIPVASFGKPVSFRMEPNPKPCRLRIRGTGAPDIWLDGEIYLPFMMGLPIEKTKIRVEADFLKMIGDFGQPGTLTVSLHNDEMCTVESLQARLTFQIMIQNGPLDIQAFFENEAIAGFNGTVDLGKTSEWPRRLLDGLAVLDKVSSNLRPADLRLSANDLYAGWNALVDFNGLVLGTDLAAQLAMDRTFPVEGITTLLAYGYVSIGEWSFSAVVSREITSKKWIGQRFAINCGAEPRLCEALVRRGPSERLIADTVAMHERTRETIGKGVIEICDGNYASMMELAAESQ